MAQKIKVEYLDIGAEYQVDLDQHLRKTFLEKYEVIEQANREE